MKQAQYDYFGFDLFIQIADSIMVLQLDEML